MRAINIISSGALTNLFKNIGYVAVSQGIANYLLPLVTIPYITRVVGPENFGVIEWITTILIYVIVVVDYSFDFTAVRKLATLKEEDHAGISKIFSTVLATKAVLFGFALLGFALATALVPQMRESALYLWFAFPVVMGWALFPNFLFLGRQKLGFSAITNLSVKVIAAALFFILVKEKSDFYLVPTINGMAQFIAGGLMFLFSFRLFKNLRLFWPGFAEIKRAIKEGSSIFFSNLFNRIQGFNAILLGGFLLLPLDMGYFSASFKLLVVAQSFVFFPLYGALFPFLSAKASENRKEYLAILKKVRNILLAVTLVVSAGVFVFADFIVRLVYGGQFAEATALLRILIPSLVFSSISHVYHFQGLQVLHQDDAYFKVMLIGVLISVPLNMVLMFGYGGIGAAWAKVILEFLLALASFSFFKSRIKKLSHAGNH